ncbi:S8 family serine peptidase [Candidatus Uhrbacteria bacterium]|nr:S8 family serine peptidase [Candidatus Uhrbacteria bacterium]
MGLIRYIGPIVALAIVPALARPVFAAEQIVPNDPGFSQQWYLNAIQAPQAWDMGRQLRGSLGQGSADVIIAIIDSGVDIYHPDLQSNIWTNPGEIPGNGIDDDRNGFVDDIHGWNFVNGTNDPRPRLDQAGDLDRSPLGVHHGTILAGLAAAAGNNQEGITGVSWSASIMPIRVIQSDGTGEAKQVVAAMNYAIDNGANVINFSFVGDTSAPSLERVIQRAAENDVLIIASAGNQIKRESGVTEVYNLDSTPLYPVCNDGTNDAIIGVTATDRNDKKSDFASFGKRCIDLSAPGEDLVVTRSTDPAFGSVRPYGSPVEGTSMSTALVSGAAALLKSLFPTTTMRRIGQVLVSTADSIDVQNPAFVGTLGAGRLNVFRATQQLKSEATIPPPQPTPITQALPAQRTETIQIARLAGKTITVYSYTLDGGLNNSIALSSPWEHMPSVAHLSSGEWVLGSPPGTESSVLILDSRGGVVRRLTPFGKGFRGGVAVVPIGTAGNERIAVVPQQNAGPALQVYSPDGRLLANQFFFNKSIRDNWIVGPHIMADGRQALRIRSATRADRTVTTDGNITTPEFADQTVGSIPQRLMSVWESAENAPWTIEGLSRSSAMRINKDVYHAYTPQFAIDVLATGVLGQEHAVVTVPRSGPGHIRVFSKTGEFQQDWFIGKAGDRALWSFAFALPFGV